MEMVVTSQKKDTEVQTELKKKRVSFQLASDDETSSEEEPENSRALKSPGLKRLSNNNNSRMKVQKAIEQDEESSESRLSPDALHFKLLTELNFLDVIEQSKQQLDALEHSKNLDSAQQETVLLAQSLQFQKIREEEEKKFQIQIEELNRRLRENMKRDSQAQTDKGQEQVKLNESIQSTKGSVTSTAEESDIEGESYSEASDEIEEDVKSVHSTKSKIEDEILSEISEKSEAAGSDDVDEEIEDEAKYSKSDISEDIDKSQSSTSSKASDGFSKFAVKILKIIEVEDQKRAKHTEMILDIRQKELEQKLKSTHSSKAEKIKLLRLQWETEKAEIERMKVDLIYT